MPRVLTQPQGEARNMEAAGQIRREALAAGATGIRLTSQCYGALQAAIGEKGRPGGVCRSLAIFWLASRFAGGDLFDKLLGPGGVIKDKSLIVKMVAGYKSEFPTSELENAYIVRELVKAKLKHTGRQWVQANKPDLGAWLCQFSTASGTGQLRVVACRAGYDHAMALDLRNKDRMAFYDPNWGEFVFPTEAKLQTFLNTSMFVYDDRSVLYGNRARIQGLEAICFA